MRIPSHLRAGAAVAALAPILAMMSPMARIVGRRMRPLDWNRPHQGVQEMARRQRQIERGQLTVSNGLQVPHG